MQETNHSRQPIARLLIDQLDSLGARAFELACDVVGFEAYVMQPAAAPREELADRVVEVERLEQFDLALSRLEQRGADALLFNRGALREVQAERVAPESQTLVEIRHDHADVVNLLEHRGRQLPAWSRQSERWSLSHLTFISSEPKVGCSVRVCASLLHAPWLLPCS